MPETRTITVTQEDISSGIPRRTVLCPFALAAKRIFPEATSTEVGWDLSVRISPGHFQFWCLSKEAWSAINQFDTKGTMEPGTYTIRLFAEF